jgi:hypothetical protein
LPNNLLIFLNQPEQLCKGLGIAAMGKMCGGEIQFVGEIDVGRVAVRDKNTKDSSCTMLYALNLSQLIAGNDKSR